MWRYPPLRAAGIAELQRLRSVHDLSPLVIHDNYLINLASPDEVIRSRSIAAYRQEVERAQEIGAEFLVAHPGSYKGQSLAEAMTWFARSLGEALTGLTPQGLTLLLENTAGQGNALGSRWEELAALRELAREVTDFPVGYCIDTCHSLAAGYDIASADGLARCMGELDRVLGFDRVHVIHANDSKGALGSRLDRHAHIGTGAIGEEGFRRLLQHPGLAMKPFILETPVDEPGDQRRNLEMLQRLSVPVMVSV